MSNAKYCGLSLAGRLLAGAVLLAGCASEKPKPAPQAAPPPPPKPVALSQIKTELLEAKAQIDSTTGALNTLQKSAAYDAQANYNRFSEEYMKLQNKQQALRARADDLKSKTTAYYDTWNKQVEVQNPELRRQAIQQRSDAQSVYNNITNEMELTRMSFEPYMANLKDVGNYLKGNLTPAGLASVSDLVTKANGQAKEVDSHVDSIVGSIDKMASATGEGAMQPGGGPTAAPAGSTQVK